LIDIYPTLLELAELDADPKHEGHSLKPLLKNPWAEWPYFARTSFGPENVAIVSQQYRYIHYHDGSEELYDKATDPHEWHNLANRPELKNVLDEHRRGLPATYHEVLGSGSTGHESYDASEKKLRR
jgi:arylsulfatase A-like enzyme